MSKVKDLYIYVGHQLPQRAKQLGAMVKIPGNKKIPCDVLRLSAKHAIQEFVDKAGLQYKLLVPQHLVLM